MPPHRGWPFEASGSVHPSLIGVSLCAGQDQDPVFDMLSLHPLPRKQSRPPCPPVGFDVTRTTQSSMLSGRCAGVSLLSSEGVCSKPEEWEGTGAHITSHLQILTLF